MVYCTTVDFIGVELKITEKEFIEKFQKHCIKNNDKMYYHEDLSVEDNYIFFEETCRKFYEHEILCDFLAPIVKGGIIYCDGDETDDFWRIIFDGKGNWKEEEGAIYYDLNPYKYFMKTLGDKLPKKLKEELEKWRMITKI